jgi:hypothetical protein
MRVKLPLFLAIVLGALCLTAPMHARGPQQVTIPNAGVPQIMTLEGKFVRVAYNNEGYVILGYQIANRTIPNDWIMLDVGITLMEKTDEEKLTRSDMSLDTPDGHVELATTAQYREDEGKLQQLQMRMRTQRDSINYFPPWTHGVNRLGFFADVSGPALAWDETSVNKSKACMGQLYFKIPGQTKYGQYWLNVKFKNSTVRVPFRLLTEDEEKTLGKNFGDIKKQIDNAFRPPKKK